MSDPSSTPSQSSIPSPEPIFQLATAYWGSATLLAAVNMGLFSLLSKGAFMASEAAAKLQSDTRAIEMLLNACCGLNLLDKSDERYQLTPLSAAYLVPGSPAYLGSALLWSLNQYPAWGTLSEAVRTGKPVVTPEEQLGDDPEKTRAFVLGMHERASGVARGVVRFLDLTGCARLLDVGVGPGTYSMLLAQQYPGLQSVVLDLPAVAAIASELIETAGLSDRVHVMAEDATQGEYGEEEYDAVLFSGVLHRMSPPVIERMLSGAKRALKEGGRVLVSDIMLDEEKTSPVFATLFSLQMLLTSGHGTAFSATECGAWLTRAGFTDISLRVLPPPLPYRVVSGRK
jgi:ubiquinone/menaquinone biosynthesis C-methylase UbiE